MKFPKVIHVTIEGDKGEEWLNCHKTGMDSVEDNDTPIAIYKLVEVGKVSITKAFTSSKKARK